MANIRRRDLIRAWIGNRGAVIAAWFSNVQVGDIRAWLFYFVLATLFLASIAIYQIQSPIPSPMNLSYDKKKSPYPNLTQFCYFFIVTITSVGFGDYVPEKPAVKVIFAASLLISSFFFVYFVAGLSYLLEKIERAIVEKIRGGRYNYWIEPRTTLQQQKLRPRVKAILSVATILVSVFSGSILIWFVEGKPYGKSFYMAVVAVTTIGYGDLTFDTVAGQRVACVWLLACSISVTASYSFIAQLAFDETRKCKIKAVLNKEINGEENRDRLQLGSFDQYFVTIVRESGLLSDEDIDTIRRKYDELVTLRERV